MYYFKSNEVALTGDLVKHVFDDALGIVRVGLGDHWIDMDMIWVKWFDKDFEQYEWPNQLVLVRRHAEKLLTWA